MYPPASSAPPQPPPMPPPPTFHSEYPPSTSTINPAIMANQNINLPSAPYLPSPVPWSTGLCDCCDDFSGCCLTFWCPCITFGRIAEIVDRGSTSCGVSGLIYTMLLCVTGCSCLYSCFYRSKLRGQYFLNESPCSDCCVHCCCEECALCQEYRELKNQGFDMSIGWHGNMAPGRHGAGVPPGVQHEMNR